MSCYHALNLDVVLELNLNHINLYHYYYCSLYGLQKYYNYSIL